jgi:Anaphase-promoting complex, cyclosome, subunit 3
MTGTANSQHQRETKPPTTPPPDMKSLVETYTSCIQQYLAVHLLDNATFYAERLVATTKTNDSLYLLALCYYRQNQPQRAKFVLQNHNCDDSPDLLYLLATASHDLEDYSTAEEALLRQARKDFRSTECVDINQFILTTSVSHVFLPCLHGAHKSP